MITIIQNLPAHILGISAEGKVTKADIETIIIPLLIDAENLNKRIYLLACFGPKFEGFSDESTLNDYSAGLRYQHLFEKCAVVSDTEWLQSIVKFSVMLVSFPVEIFANSQIENAKKWLS